MSLNEVDYTGTPDEYRADGTRNPVVVLRPSDQISSTTGETSETTSAKKSTMTGAVGMVDPRIDMPTPTGPPDETDNEPDDNFTTNPDGNDEDGGPSGSVKDDQKQTTGDLEDVEQKDNFTFPLWKPLYDTDVVDSFPPERLGDDDNDNDDEGW